MDCYLPFSLRRDGSMALSESATDGLRLLLDAAHADNKRVSIVLTCEENRDIRLLLQVRPTTSWASLSTSWPRHLCSQLLGRRGSVRVGSGGVVTEMTSTSEHGKAE
jgi:hypothetical protein